LSVDRQGTSPLVRSQTCDDGSGGNVDFAITSDTAYSWIVQDDSDSANDDYSSTSASWRWNPCCTDGGALGTLGGSFDVTIDPTFDSGIDTWTVLSGDGSEIDLALDQPVHIFTGECSD